MNFNRSQSRQKHKKGKWIIILIILTFVTFKIYKRNVGPASTFADESTPVISAVEPDIEDSAPLPTTTNPVSEPSLHQIAESSSKSNPELATSIDDVLAGIEANPSRIIEARSKLNKMLSMNMSEQQLSFVKKQLSALSEKWLFSRAIFEDDELCGRYKVKPADLLEVLGKKFNVPYGIIMQINNISNPKALRAGDTIKVINGPFHCKIYRSTFTMDLYLQDTFVRSFTIGLGKPGMETPTGRWVVEPTGKLLSPTWTDPDTGKTYLAEDPAYPLGTRWIGLDGLDGNAKGRTGFAIHGTKDPQQLGTAGSRGCVRLHNDDVELVYDLLRAGVSQVIIVE